MSDFDLDTSRWYNMMRIGLATRDAKNSAAIVIERTRHLGKFEFEPTILTELVNAETALSEALFAVKTAKEEYRRVTNPTLVAAE